MSVPLKPSREVYVNEPSLVKRKLPLVGGSTIVALNLFPSASVSLVSTPEATSTFNS
ncbi:MAG: hypothetical protein MJK14_23860 [Rivularia sp. ALOHA_DT_140]|nr:hypothetical protein [Rivularia sp. ALOHA_DT_140]